MEFAVGRHLEKSSILCCTVVVIPPPSFSQSYTRLMIVPNKNENNAVANLKVFHVYVKILSFITYQFCCGAFCCTVIELEINTLNSMTAMVVLKRNSIIDRAKSIQQRVSLYVGLIESFANMSLVLETIVE